MSRPRVDRVFPNGRQKTRVSLFVRISSNAPRALSSRQTFAEINQLHLYINTPFSSAGRKWRDVIIMRAVNVRKTFIFSPSTIIVVYWPAERRGNVRSHKYIFTRSARVCVALKKKKPLNVRNPVSVWSRYYYINKSRWANSRAGSHAQRTRILHIHTYIYIIAVLTASVWLCTCKLLLNY